VSPEIAADNELDGVSVGADGLRDHLGSGIADNAVEQAGSQQP
jgi:hypothetical protein